MKHNKKISPQSLIALKNALTHIYWLKKDLKLFVNHTISSKAFVNTLNWDQYKRAIASDIVDRMSGRLDIFEDDLFTLIREVSDMSDNEKMHEIFINDSKNIHNYA